MLTPVNTIFFQLRPYWPQLMNSQKIPDMVKVKWEANKAEISPRRSLKLGMLSAMIHASAQRTPVISSQ